MGVIISGWIFSYFIQVDGWDRWDRWDGLLKPFLFDDGFMPDLGVFCLFFSWTTGGLMMTRSDLLVFSLK